MLSPEENELLTRTGPGTAMGELFRRFWTPILLVKELPAADCPPVRVKVLGEDLVAFRDSNGRIGLLDAYCRHRRADLFYGRNEECGLRCVYHGWKYDVEGRLVDMPNEPEEFRARVQSQIRIKAYPTREQGGVIWAYMGPRELMPAFPQIEWTLVPDSHRHVGKVFVDCNYLQAQEGNFDSTHVPFLHVGKNPELTSHGLARRSDRRLRNRSALREKWLVWAPKVTDYGLLAANRRRVEDDTVWAWHINHFLMPYTALVAGGTPGSPFLVNMHIPMADETHCAWIIQWHPDRPLTAEELYDYEHGYGFLPELIPGTFVPRRNRENDYLIDRGHQRVFSWTGIGHSFFEQDMAVTGSQGRIADRSQEYLGTADVMIIALRRLLLRAAKELQAGKEPYWAHHPEAYKVRSIDIVLPKDVPPDEGAKEWITAARKWVAAEV